MEYIGLIGLIGLLGFFAKSGFNEKVDEIKSDVAKNNEQIESRVKNVEKIAADANRKAQDLSSESQHFVTKIDAEKISDRLKVVENSNRAIKVDEFEGRLKALQKLSDDIAQVNFDLQQGLKNIEDKKFDETIQTFGGNLQTLTDNLKTLDEGVKTFDERLKTFDERLKNLEETPPAEVDEKKSDELLKTIDEDHQDITKKLESYNATVQQHHVALAQWKNNFIVIQKTFNAIQTRFDEHKKTLDAMQEHLNTQGKALENFQDHLNNQGKALENFQNHLSAQGNGLGNFQEQLNAQGRALGNFKNQIDAQEKTFGDFQTKFDAQEKNFGDVQKKFDEQGSVIESLQKNVADFAKIFESLKGQTFLTIENFNIQPTGRIFFTNKPDEVFNHLKIASNLTGITSFLESSNFDKKENFIRIIENYRQNLKKVTDKMRRKKFNEDALSEEVTEAFFNTLSKFFLATIPISIYRGARQETLEAVDEQSRDEEFKFYSTFLAKVNEYLAACQVYTIPVLPKNLMTSADIDRMSVTRKETSNDAEDNVIDEVERLPYYMDYLTEGGETENFCSEGKMVVFKFDGGAQ